MLSTFERYLQKADSRDFLIKLGLPNVETIVKNVEYFTEKEAEKRDEIVKGYFGEAGINTIVSEVAKNLKEIGNGVAVLDVGAGTGFFTFKIAEKLAGCDMNFYAFDATPAMLAVLLKKLSELENVQTTPLLGVAERISENLSMSQKVYKSLGMLLPRRFDAIVSILMLHHCKNLPEVFSSMKRAIKRGGRLILVDLCRHDFKEFREEMGDVHLGFELDYIKFELGKNFSVKKVEKMPGGCKCEESGRSADLFIAIADGKIN
jgi:ubiquinone/menaquinone biosynthesis C-methylase UbiE